jgi:hypothetical protein
MRDMKNSCNILVGKPDVKRPLGRIIIERILGKYGGNVRTGFIWLRKADSGGLFEHGNEPAGFIKGREFLD